MPTEEVLACETGAQKRCSSQMIVAAFRVFAERDVDVGVER